MDVDPQDGRIYYVELSTGRKSWQHPLAPPPPQPRAQPFSSNRNLTTMNGFYDKDASNEIIDIMIHADNNPRYAYRRPENHQCSAVAPTVLHFPLGLFALYHSRQTDLAWKKGRYGDAINHARQNSTTRKLGNCHWSHFLDIRVLLQTRQTT